MNKQFTSLPRLYDRLNGGFDCVAWTDYICGVLEARGVMPGALVLDLACGTGRLTVSLAGRGYDMIGLDSSADMLGEARNRRGAASVLWTAQSMCDFELYGTVAAVICTSDSLNYLMTVSELDQTFSLVNNYLDPGGVFVFDISDPLRYTGQYASGARVIEGNGAYCVRSSVYNPSSRICNFYLNLFSRDADGRWIRRDEHQRQRCWSPRTLRYGLKHAGFALLSEIGNQSVNPLCGEHERIFFIAVKDE